MKRIVLPFAAGAVAAALVGGLVALGGPAPAAEIEPAQTPTPTPTCVPLPAWPLPTAIPTTVPTSVLPPLPTNWPPLPVPTCAAPTRTPSPSMP